MRNHPHKAMVYLRKQIGDKAGEGQSLKLIGEVYRDKTIMRQLYWLVLAT
jgi:hypothetical protein